jgi:hypothetical protein
MRRRSLVCQRLERKKRVVQFVEMWMVIPVQNRRLKLQMVGWKDDGLVSWDCLRPPHEKQDRRRHQEPDHHLERTMYRTEVGHYHLCLGV